MTVLCYGAVLRCCVTGLRTELVSINPQICPCPASPFRVHLRHIFDGLRTCAPNGSTHKEWRKVCLDKEFQGRYNQAIRRNVHALHSARARTDSWSESTRVFSLSVFYPPQSPLYLLPPYSTNSFPSLLLRKRHSAREKVWRLPLRLPFISCHSTDIFKFLQYRKLKMSVVVLPEAYRFLYFHNLS